MEKWVNFWCDNEKSTTATTTFIGIDAHVIEVEADVTVRQSPPILIGYGTKPEVCDLISPIMAIGFSTSNLRPNRLLAASDTGNDLRWNDI